MKVLLQRVSRARCVVGDEITGEIGPGLVVYVGFTNGDTLEDVQYLARKLLRLRIFDDEKGVMNLSLMQTGLSVLSISQFTLYANTKKGNRPSYSSAMSPGEASELYHLWNEHLRQLGIKVQTGVFGAHMNIYQVGDGPVSIMLTSEKSK
jgi:D-tyrosyl-tRNA(Tyr) deacylase